MRLQDGKFEGYMNGYPFFRTIQKLFSFQFIYSIFFLI